MTPTLLAIMLIVGALIFVVWGIVDGAKKGARGFLEFSFGVLLAGAALGVAVGATMG